MAIKWKNSEKRENAVKERKNWRDAGKQLLKIGQRIVVELRKQKKVLAVIFGVAAAAIYVHITFENYPTRAVWFLGFIFNLFLSFTVITFVGMWIQRRYQNWNLEDEAFYEEWKIRWKKQQQIMLAVFGGLVVLVTWMLAVRGDSRYYYYYNYAVQYLTYFTVMLQCCIAEVIIRNYFLRCLQDFMDARNRIIEQKMAENLEKALEIERQSLLKVSRSDQLRMDLITNVSHDLKTPLTSMVGYLELLKKEEVSDTARDYLEVISNRAGRLKEMIESLFSLAKVSSGNVELKRDHITLNRLIEQIFADMDDKMQNSGLQFVTLLDEGNTGMVTDNGYMYRICQNLVENALKYSAKGTRVFVKTCLIGQKTIGANVENGLLENDGMGVGAAAAENSKICLEITNTAGYQMDFKKEDIVERFARADKARSTEGNGLGLAIVSTYAAALGGEFDIFIDYDQFKARLVFPRELPTSAEADTELLEASE